MPNTAQVFARLDSPRSLDSSGTGECVLEAICGDSVTPILNLAERQAGDEHGMAKPKFIRPRLGPRGTSGGVCALLKMPESERSRLE